MLEPVTLQQAPILGRTPTANQRAALSAGRGTLDMRLQPLLDLFGEAACVSAAGATFAVLEDIMDRHLARAWRHLLAMGLVTVPLPAALAGLF